MKMVSASFLHGTIRPAVELNTSGSSARYAATISRMDPYPIQGRVAVKLAYAWHSHWVTERRAGTLGISGPY